MATIDSVADMLTRIRNSHARLKTEVSMPSSKLRIKIAQILDQEGYIKSYRVDESIKGKPVLIIKLKYFQNKPVIEKLQRVSRPGLRCYKPVDELPDVLGGLGIAIISTSKGVMTAKAAKEVGIGGEVLCVIA